PVHVEIPVDVLEAPYDPTRLAQRRRSAPSAAPVAEPGAIATAARTLGTAVSSVLVVGGGARAAAAEVAKLAVRLNAPVVSTVNGKGVLPETHPLSLGAAIRLPEAHHIIDGADVVVVIGSELGDSDLWGHTLSPRGIVVRLDIDESQLDKNVPAKVRLHGDAATTLRTLLKVLPDNIPGILGSRTAAIRAACDRGALREGEPWAPYHDALRESLPAETIIAGDSAQVSYYGTVHQWPCLRPGQFVYPVGYATLGYGIPAGIGAALAAPDTPVIVLAGDGGTVFTIQEFLTAVELGLSLPVVVMNNGGYGEIRDEMDQRGIPRMAVDLHSPDFAALGRAFGGVGVAVDEPDAVAHEVVRALGRKGPTLIDVGVGQGDRAG
ncbi:MAG: thiamine pyrophosphate-binding protein, partial [Haloechinothrix sp.]